MAQTCHAILGEAGIPHAVMGGVAVCLHGYQRNTLDLDLLIRPEDSAAIRRLFEEAGFVWHEQVAEFRAPSEVAVQCVLASQRAGRGSDVYLPDPADEKAVTVVEGLPVLALPKLIESKLACGQGSVRRTHKDFADVVELIAKHNLNSSFARHLHKSLRDTFRALVRQSRSEP